MSDDRHERRLFTSVSRCMCLLEQLDALPLWRQGNRKADGLLPYLV
jgi:hypothetical protein